MAKEVLPKRKQVLALSATYSPALLAELDGLMSEPHHVMLCPETVSLLGVKQFFVELSGCCRTRNHLSHSLNTWGGPSRTA